MRFGNNWRSQQRPTRRPECAHETKRVTQTCQLEQGGVRTAVFCRGPLRMPRQGSCTVLCLYFYWRQKLKKGWTSQPFMLSQDNFFCWNKKVCNLVFLELNFSDVKFSLFFIFFFLEIWILFCEKLAFYI